MGLQVGDQAQTLINGRLAGIITIQRVEGNTYFGESGLGWHEGDLQPYVNGKTAVSPLEPTQNSIAQGLAIFHPPGEVFEVRMLNVPKGNSGYIVSTISGYFNDPAKAEKALKPYLGKTTIYQTVNPINPDLLGRANNRLVEKPKATTADQDVTWRRWLPIDIDPKRSSGISSTNEELQHALTLRDEIAAWLAGLGWQPAIKAMSGNGGHLLYRIDMPNDEESRNLIQAFLNSLAKRFNNDKVEVDTTVYNAARIWKVYNTVACKGDNIPTRPHRKTEITEYYPQAAIVTAGMITAVIPPKDNQSTAVTASEDIGKGYTEAEIIRALDGNGIRYRRKQDGKGRVIFDLDKCLTSEAHTDGACITLEAGKAGYKCHHNSCANQTWQHIKPLLFPERNQQTAVDKGANLTHWQIYTLHDAYAARPPQKFVVDGVIATPSLNIFYGSPGVLKSLVLADMCADVVSGGRWLITPENKESGIATIPTAALWIDQDNGKKVSDERFEAMGRARELSADVPLCYVCLPNPPVNASDKESILMLGNYIRTLKIGLVVIDNLGAITGGIDENSSLMAGVMSNLRFLAEIYNVAVILIHHQSKTVRPNGRLGDSLRGHSSIEASLDLAMLVIREASSNQISLIATKVRRAGVENLHAQFVFTHKPGTKELATARFLQVSIKDTSSDQAIQTAVLDVLKKEGKLSKGKLKEAVKATGITAGLQKIGSVTDAMRQQEMVTVKEQGNGRAVYFSLPTLTPL